MTYPTRWLPLVAALLAALTLSRPALAQQTGSFENLDRLDSLVAMTVGAQLGEPGGPIAPIDRRLRLAPCPQIPKVEGPVFSAAIVSCPTTGWRIRVPLAAGGNNVSAAPAVAGGSAIRAFSAVAPAIPVIKKGDPVQLVAGDATFAVSRLMVAEENGAVGALIRVREDARSTPVSARVEGPGIVRIPGL